MITMPKRNLAPESEPWGRKVDERLDQIDKTVAQNKQDTSNSQSAINSTVTKLSEQVAAIDELTQELAEQQATLEAQQAQLAAQVQAMEEVINAQVYPVAVHSEAEGFTLYAGTNATITSATVPVPAGYSRALVYATATLSAINSTATPDFVSVGIRINGVSDGYSTRCGVLSGSAGALSSTDASLIDGGSVTIEARASTDYGVWFHEYSVVSLDAMVIFLR